MNIDLASEIFGYCSDLSIGMIDSNLRTFGYPDCIKHVNKNVSEEEFIETMNYIVNVVMKELEFKYNEAKKEIDDFFSKKRNSIFIERNDLDVTIELHSIPNHVYFGM